MDHTSTLINDLKWWALWAFSQFPSRLLAEHFLNAVSLLWPKKKKVINHVATSFFSDLKTNTLRLSWKYGGQMCTSPFSLYIIYGVWAYSITFPKIKLLVLGQICFLVTQAVSVCLSLSFFVEGLWMKMLEGRLISPQKNYFLQAKLLPSVAQIPEALRRLPSSDTKYNHQLCHNTIIWFFDKRHSDEWKQFTEQD